MLPRRCLYSCSPHGNRIRVLYLKQSTITVAPALPATPARSDEVVAPEILRDIPFDLTPSALIPADQEVLRVRAVAPAVAAA